MWEEHEGNVQRLQGEIAAAQAQLKDVQILAVQGSMSPEEAKPFIYNARETIERNQKKIDAIQQGLEVKDRLAQVISQVCSDTKGKLERKLKKSEPLALQTLVQQIFEEFTIGKRGYGRGCESWVEEGYILREGLQDLLGLRGTSVEVT
jgi:hypothetical protein